MPNTRLKLSEAWTLVYHASINSLRYFSLANDLKLFSCDPNVFPAFLHLKQHTPNLVLAPSVIGPTEYEHKRV